MKKIILGLILSLIMLVCVTPADAHSIRPASGHATTSYGHGFSGFSGGIYTGGFRYTYTPVTPVLATYSYQIAPVPVALSIPVDPVVTAPVVTAPVVQAPPQQVIQVPVPVYTAPITYTTSYTAPVLIQQPFQTFTSVYGINYGGVGYGGFRGIHGGFSGGVHHRR